MSIETYHSEGYSARILSPIMEPTSDCQMKYFFFIYGDLPGQLRIHTRSAINGDYKTYVVQKDAEKEYWQKGFVDFTESEPYQIIVEAVVGRGYWHDIALGKGSNLQKHFS